MKKSILYMASGLMALPLALGSLSASAMGNLLRLSDVRLTQSSGQSQNPSQGQQSQGQSQQKLLNEVASALNMNTTDLQNQLNSGKTLNQILQSKGMSQDQFKNNLTNQANNELNEKVQNGSLTQQQADQYKQQFQQMLNSHLNDILNKQYPLQQQQGGQSGQSQQGQSGQSQQGQ